MSNPAICEEINKPHCSPPESGLMRDLCDGEFVKTHPIFQKHKEALQFVMYYDDVEVCNPLGSSAGVHKLGRETLQKYTQQLIINAS